MTHQRPLDDAISRRDLLRGGAAAALLGAVGSSILPSASDARRAYQLRWPSRPLPASAAQSIESAQFFSTRQLAAYGAEVNQLGLRVTGGRRHEAYVRLLARRLRRAGLRGVQLEGAPLKQWQATDWSVLVDGKTFPHTYYVPYSQATGPSGLTAPLVYVPVGETASGAGGDPVSAIQGAIGSTDLTGKIAVFDVGYESLPLAAFAAIAYPGGLYDPNLVQDANGVYSRPWLNSIPNVLQALTAAGAVGTIGIWPDLPGDWARQYTPYDAVDRPIPGLWIDRDGGARLKQLAGNGAKATVKLQAQVRNVITHNVIGYIPGASTKELTVLHTHTDGTNGMEENGQIPILAAAQYLARLPRKSLQRPVMVLLTAGHFAGGVGARSFLARHQNDLVPRISSVYTLEHVGCTEWLPTSSGQIRPTGRPENTSYFAPDSKGMVSVLETAQQEDNITSVVARPFLPSAGFPGAKEPLYWPGEGTYLYTDGGVLDGNHGCGPYGLITADLDTTGMVDYALMRRKAMITAKAIVQLAATSASDLAATFG